MKPRSARLTIPDHSITRLLREMRIEAAIGLIKAGKGELDASAVKVMIREYESQVSQMQAAGEVGEARRLVRRTAALNNLLLHGPEPSRLVAETELPEGYTGKVLMILVTGGGFKNTAILRSGDGWHREILQNTRAEIADLGFPGAEVHPLGGAYVGFDSEDSIVIWGTSDEYGCCDKELAALMIERAYPGKPLRIED